MAESVFQVNDINVSLTDKKITVEFSKDVDPDTISQNSISLFNNDYNMLEVVTLEVKNKFVYVNFLNDPIPNVEYVLYVQPVVKSLIEEINLSNVVSRTIVFKSEVTSSVVIKSPVDYQKFENAKIHLEWQEFGSTPENFYRVQIAQENIFANPVFNFTVADKNEIDLEKSIEEGQYYVRIRAEKSDADTSADCGRWSKIVTFVTSGYETDLDSEEIEDGADWSTVNDDDITVEDFVKNYEETNAEYEEVYELLPENIKIFYSDEINTETAVINIVRRDV